MKEVLIEDLKAGTKFSKPVYVDGENLLVPANVEIKEKDIRRLEKWGLERVFTDGDIITGAKDEDTASSEQLADQKSILIYHSAVEQMELLFSDCRKGLRMDSEQLESVMEDFYPLVLENPEECLVLTTLSVKTKEPLARSAVNCMILSTALGIKLKVPQHRLRNLAIASLIHDVGMTRIPMAITKKKGSLTAQERETVNTHTLFAYRFALKELGLPEEVGRIAMGHHERWDGKGYPRGLAGNKISIGSRILSVTDAFVAMGRDRADRGSMTGYLAIRQILNDNARRFDPDILKFFIQSIGIYPRGSIVVLNNNAIGRIVKIHAKAPLRPGIQLMIDERGRKPKPGAGYMDLLQETEVFIARAVDPKDLAKAE